ncbi:MAG: 2Fe-2S iron-sulfur cluster binding domain-containing protein [Rhodospirillaceae bacterium]
MTDKITIEFKGSGVTADWDPKFENILDFAEELGLMPPFSCRQGYCHTCMCGLVDGEIEYTDPDALPPDDEMQTLICCAVPKTSLVLDI